MSRLLQVDRATVTRWIKKGLIKGANRPEGTRNWRIPLPSYEAFVNNYHESR